VIITNGPEVFICSIPPSQTINEHRRPSFILISATLSASQPYIVKNMALETVYLLPTFHHHCHGGLVAWSFPVYQGAFRF
jgi:hypothetical protein